MTTHNGPHRLGIRENFVGGCLVLVVLIIGALYVIYIAIEFVGMIIDIAILRRFGIGRKEKQTLNGGS